MLYRFAFILRLIGVAKGEQEGLVASPPNRLQGHPGENDKSVEKPMRGRVMLV